MADKISTIEYWSAVGRRKTAIASVRISLKDKSLTINGKKVELPAFVVSPFIIAGEGGKFGVSASVSGGGKESQYEAIRLGIARALEKFNPDFRTTLKKEGFLSRDPREKERKKPGLKGARRAPQWAKR